MRTFTEDYNNGITRQDWIMNKMNSKGFNFQATPKFHPLDCYDADRNIYLEVKSRTNSSTTYPDTMIGLNKIQFCKEVNEKHNSSIFLIFEFTDKLMYIPYDKSLLELPVKKMGRMDRGSIESQNYTLIPISKLQEFHF
jgi:hypothetical protein